MRFESWVEASGSVPKTPVTSHKLCPSRNQSYLQLLCSLQNKLVISEGKAEDKDVKGRALTAKSKSP